MHRCLVNLTTDQFQCLCPYNTELAPGLSDCLIYSLYMYILIWTHAVAKISISEWCLLSLQSQFHCRFYILYFFFIKLENSNMPVLSDSDLCVLFWLVEDKLIVLITNVVRWAHNILCYYGRVDLILSNTIMVIPLQVLILLCVVSNNLAAYS